MFSKGSIVRAALVLGASALVPATAKADRFHDDRGRGPARVEVRGHVEEHRAPERHVDVRVERRDHVDRDRVRVDIAPLPVPVPVYVNQDFDRSIGLSQVPACVIDTVNYQRRGPIDSIEWVCRGGSEYYRFVVDSPTGHLDMRVDPAGRLISINPC